MSIDTPRTDAAELVSSTGYVYATVTTEFARQLERELAESKRGLDCTRSHPHEDMSPICELHTRRARAENNEAVRGAELARMTKVAYELAVCVDVYHKLSGGQGTKARLALEELKAITGKEL